MNSNGTIKAMLGTGSAQGTTAPSQNSPALKNIATNGALLNQNLSVLIQKLSSLTKSWGG